MDGERADEQAGQEPHRPGAAADPRRAVFPPEVEDLWHIGKHRNRDAGDTEDFEQRALHLLWRDPVVPTSGAAGSPESTNTSGVRPTSAWPLRSLLLDDSVAGDCCGCASGCGSA